ncbi:MAG: hypothetical protein ABI637_05585 [Gemmatimonadota bacterium]
MTMTLIACNRGASGDRAAAQTLDTTAAAAPVAAPPDSLVVTGRGLEVWFTLARTDHAADGAACTDRTIEIRRGERRVAVPLLYTEQAPRMLDDSTLEATLYRNCQPAGRYHVDTRTGQPAPVHGG